MRIIYLGTPDFAVPPLKALIEDPFFEVLAVVCQPDRPSGRGNKVQAPPVKQTAVKAGIPVLQPERLASAAEIVATMKALEPDVLVMVAFGQILKKPVLNLAPLGVVNLHGSLLPQLRGAAPINWAILNGQTVTGLTTMATDPGVDTGPMLLKETVEIKEDMDAVELAAQMSRVGADLIVRTLKGLAEGSIEPEVQDDSLSTYAPLLSKEMGLIDWRLSALEIHNRVRGLRPWPGAYSGFNQMILKINKTAVVMEQDEACLTPGTLVIKNNSIRVACGPTGSQRLDILIVQPAAKPSMPFRDWANGVRLKDGQRLEYEVLAQT